MSQQQHQLRMLLQRIDLSAQSIQSAASAMMRHYDRSTGVAVQEWRNALQSCTPQQLLPLLYVANEVIQTSKRNRGNHFLEALSPVLGQSLAHICRSDPNVTEKVRRTVKIWGDRRVFSVRFINELLKGLEPYRQNSNNNMPKQAPARPRSPQQELPSLPAPRAPPVPTPTFSPTPQEDEQENTGDDNKNTNNNEEEDLMEILEQTQAKKQENKMGDLEDGDGGNDDEENENDGEDDGNDDDDDDDDVFGDGSERQKLSININIDSAALAAPDGGTGSGTPSSGRTSKRRRSSTGSGSGSHQKRRKSTTVLSAAHFVELWQRLANMQQRFETSQMALQRMDRRHKAISPEQLQSLVGDDLQQAYQQNEQDRRQMIQERKNLHAMAVERHAIEIEARRYLPWLEKQIQQDQDDILFSNQLELKIRSFAPIHAAMVRARDQRRAEEERIAAEKAERERLQREKDEAERFRKAALAKVTEAQPGMVWNKTTGEYVSLDTDESWRD